MSDAPGSMGRWTRVLLFGSLGFAIAFAWQSWSCENGQAWTSLLSKNLVDPQSFETLDEAMIVQPIREVAVDVEEPHPAPADVLSTPTLQDQALGLLQAKCGTCHAGPDREPTGFDVSDPTSFGDILRSGYPEDSLLFQVVAAGEGESMPPEDSGIEPLTESELVLVRSWIESQRAERSVVSLREELAQVVKDRAAIGQAADDAIYVSLRNLHNRRDVTDEQLDLARFGFAKMINSLQWQPRVIVPIAVDSQQLLYRISAKELGWDETAVRSLKDRYPYRAIPNDQTDSATRRASRALLRLDWLVNEWSKPAIYHQFLMDTTEVRPADSTDNPFDTLSGLLGFLHADYEQRFATAKIDRVYIDKGKGTRGSEVSDNYRVLDRLEAITGIVWISHDFQFNDGVQDIKRRPWGPPSKNREDAVSFHQNGGEVIFELPNGLHGYFIADAEGGRLGTAPVEIVREPFLQQSPTGQSTISTGVACFRCHAGGYRRRQTIMPDLNSTGLDEHERPHVLDDTAFSQQVQQDNVNYLNTLADLRAKMGVSITAEDSREPISEVVRLYREPLDTMTLAIELGRASEDVDEESLLKTIESTLREELANVLELGEQASDDSPSISELIDDVIQDASVSGEVQREDFEAVFSHLLFQFQLMEPS